jgi:dipeptidyl aminopeptidase/acylaminoacyl peptidase
MKILRVGAFLSLAFVSSFLPAGPGLAEERRLLTLDDQFEIKDVSDPQISPDGSWVAYRVRTYDLKEDRSQSDLYMTRWDGSETVRLTFTAKERESAPRFSPDGRYLAFLSSRDNEHESAQVWLLNRQGGEAERVTDLKGGVSDYAWSPDGKRLALIAEDPDPDEAEDEKKGEKKKDEKTPKPIVVDRYQFKQDGDGYLGKKRSHLYLFDLATRKAEILTPGDHDEQLPSWSPDGSLIAFVSKRGPDPDRHDNWDIHVIEAKAGAKARQVTTSPNADGDPSFGSAPEWSPDGKHLAFLHGGPQRLIYYAVHHLAVIPVAGGQHRLVTPGLDRWVRRPTWSEDGRSIVFLLEDDRNQHLARVPAAGGTVERLLAGRRVVGDYAVGPSGKIALLSSTPLEPNEVFALEGKDQTRPLSRQNDAFLAKVRLGAVEETSFKSKDGTVVGGLIALPPDYQKGRKVPAVLDIHGGPVGQHGNEFYFDWQMFAAAGYAVIGPNPRGSSGRGEAFSTAIYADWGRKDAQDVLASVDDAVARGIADPARLGVGGWSYGGILTNYVIVQDRRFKAAVSGAGISNILAGYGTDQYIREYEAELGKPWEKTEVWTRLSNPFLKADAIVTPTLFLCGEKDFNVPLLNSEQMYQALKSLGRDTQLIIYPGQYHGITKPSYQKDRLQRYLDWFGKYLGVKSPARAK